VSLGREENNHASVLVGRKKKEARFSTNPKRATSGPGTGEKKRGVGGTGPAPGWTNEGEGGEGGRASLNPAQGGNAPPPPPPPVLGRKGKEKAGVAPGRKGGGRGKGGRF